MFRRALCLLNLPSNHAIINSRSQCHHSPYLPGTTHQLQYVLLFPKKTTATAGCSSLELFGLFDGDVEMYFYLLLGLSPVVMKRYHFGQVGGNK